MKTNPSGRDAIFNAYSTAKWAMWDEAGEVEREEWKEQALALRQSITDSKAELLAPLLTEA